MKVVWVEWVDSRAVDPSWFALDDADFDTDLLQTVGFLVSEDKKRLVLVSGHDPHMGKVAGGMIIPKSAIRSRKVLT